jgi:hypothetical protein
MELLSRNGGLQIELVRLEDIPQCGGEHLRQRRHSEVYRERKWVP